MSLIGKDLLIADFESDDYAGWTVEGTAFGNKPARGALPNQQKVTGFKGKGLANSFYGRDQSKGVLTSQEFKIERKYIKFLVGGGGHETTAIRLLLDGKVVRKKSGPRTSAEGTEALEKASWDVSDLMGEIVVIQIVDQHQGGWGHINIDHIVQSDEPELLPVYLKRKIAIDAPYLQLPLVKRQKRLEEGVERFTVEDTAGNVLRYVHLKMAAAGEEPDFWYSYDLTEFMGQEVFLRFKSLDPQALNNLVFSDEERIAPDAYEGDNRPKYHFTPRIGWMNDINGVYFHEGLYHLFYQYNPATTAASTGFDMHWGHSVSRDLLHWEEWPVALFPDKNQDNKYSGTALLVNQRIKGVNLHAELPTPVLFYTGTETGQCLATSIDGGKHWKQHSRNPVVSKSDLKGRDPKVIWHEPSQHYVMLVWAAKTKSSAEGFAILRSRDLVGWERVGLIPHWYECPEFVPVKTTDDGETIWMLYGFNRRPGHPHLPSAYQLGTFDGKTFTPLNKVRPAHLGPNFYAALTFVGAPDNHPVMMGWTRGQNTPGEPFNQTATVPLELSLKTSGETEELYFYPIERLEELRGEPLITMQNVTAESAREKLATLPQNGAFDVVVKIESRPETSLEVKIRGVNFSYDGETRMVTLVNAQGKPIKEKQLHPEKIVEARFLIDRGVVESFWNLGQAAFSNIDYNTQMKTFDLSGDLMIKELTVYPMNNVWEKK